MLLQSSSVSLSPQAPLGQRCVVLHSKRPFINRCWVTRQNEDVSVFPWIEDPGLLPFGVFPASVTPLSFPKGLEPPPSLVCMCGTEVWSQFMSVWVTTESYSWASLFLCVTTVRATIQLILTISGCLVWQKLHYTYFDNYLHPFKTATWYIFNKRHNNRLKDLASDACCDHWSWAELMYISYSFEPQLLWSN